MDEKKKYKFVGTSSMVGSMEFERPGQVAEFTNDMFEEVLRGGGMFVPAETFDGEFVNVPADKMQEYSNPYFVGQPSEDYLNALERCREHARELHRAAIE